MSRALWEIRRTWDGVEVPASEHVEVRLERGADSCSLEITAPYHGDPAPPAPPGPQPGLWEFEVVELFLVGANERYLEIEVGPHGHHWVLVLEGRRCVVREGVEIELHVDLDLARARWRAHARLASDLLPPGLARANAYAIHGQGGSRRYLAADPVPGPEPDFHRLEAFGPFEAF